MSGCSRTKSSEVSSLIPPVNTVFSIQGHTRRVRDGTCRPLRPNASRELTAPQSWHTVMLFVACMLLNPEAQRKGQEEIDRVVGAGRLPDFTDRDALPYVECIVQETMRYLRCLLCTIAAFSLQRCRWHPVLPLGVPHKAVAADEYRGMHIPAGATVIANARCVSAAAPSAPVVHAQTKQTTN